uniref:Uncharacterized protein n=1 Tax=Carnobacterium maltaromaticum TaxID=2751 RepID=A0A1Z5AYL1_CARML|nr:protein of unknown function [Carnobacterium maltaromaticum]
MKIHHIEFKGIRCDSALIMESRTMYSIKSTTKKVVKNLYVDDYPFLLLLVILLWRTLIVARKRIDLKNNIIK